MFLSEWREFPLTPCLVGKETWWELVSWFCWNRVRPWHISKLVSFLVELKLIRTPVYVKRDILTLICVCVCVYTNASWGEKDHRVRQRLTFFGMWCWVTRRAVPSISKDHSAFIFRVNQFESMIIHSHWTARFWRWRPSLPSKLLELLTQQQYHSPEDMYLDHHHTDNLTFGDIQLLSCFTLRSCNGWHMAAGAHCLFCWSVAARSPSSTLPSQMQSVCIRFFSLHYLMEL